MRRSITVWGHLFSLLPRTKGPRTWRYLLCLLFVHTFFIKFIQDTSFTLPHYTVTHPPVSRNRSRQYLSKRLRWKYCELDSGLPSISTLSDHLITRSVYLVIHVYGNSPLFVPRKLLFILPVTPRSSYSFIPRHPPLINPLHWTHLGISCSCSNKIDVTFT